MAPKLICKNMALDVICICSQSRNFNFPQTLTLNYWKHYTDFQNLDTFDSINKNISWRKISNIVPRTENIFFISRQETITTNYKKSWLYMSITLWNLEIINLLSSMENIPKRECKPREFPQFVFFGILMNKQGSGCRRRLVHEWGTVSMFWMLIRQ